MLFFNHVERAEFIDRPNRFLVKCLKNKKEITAFLPNPGRLQELLLPGRDLLLNLETGSGLRKYPYTVVAVEREGIPIMLHTHRNNDVARYLIDQGMIPGLEEARVIGKEIPVGHSRFDLLVEDEREKILLEVKSCTLAGNRIVMFPDAITDRGARHLRELARLAENHQSTGVLFVVHWPKARYFLPDYHTDLHFAQTMLDCRSRIKFFPVAVKWNQNLSLDSKTRLLNIPWDFIEREALDRGSYLLILKSGSAKRTAIGKFGKVSFPEGYYIYVGSAMAGLTARIERHRRLRKKYHWHIDYFRQETEFVTALPVRASVSLECHMASALEKITDWSIPRFGSSDCSCPSHLFGMKTSPLRSAKFIELIQYFRMDRLLPLLK